MTATARKIGEKIKNFRLDRELTQEELAIRAKLDITTINRIENGKQTASLTSLNKIAKAIKVNVSDLVK